jgi:hypothetical protein
LNRGGRRALKSAKTPSQRPEPTRPDRRPLGDLLQQAARLGEIEVGFGGGEACALVNGRRRLFLLLVRYLPQRGHQQCAERHCHRQHQQEDVGPDTQPRRPLQGRRSGFHSVHRRKGAARRTQHRKAGRKTHGEKPVETDRCAY